MTAERTCGHCGKPFTVRYPSETQRFCSRSCGNGWRGSERAAAATAARMAGVRQAKAAKAATLAQAVADEDILPPDAYDLEYARQHRDPDRKVWRMAPFAADLARSVQARDGYGVRTLFARLARRDFAGLAGCDLDTLKDTLIITLAAVADTTLLTGEREERSA